MTKQRKPASLPRKIISFFLLALGGWLLTEAAYHPYWTYTNSVLASGQGKPYSSKDVIPELVFFLVTLLIAAGAVWGASALWGQWKCPLGLILAAFGLLYLIPENPYALTSGFITCQVSCKIYGTSYLLAGAGLFVYQLRKDKE